MPNQAVAISMANGRPSRRWQMALMASRLVSEKRSRSGRTRRARSRKSAMAGYVGQGIGAGGPVIRRQRRVAQSETRAHLRCGAARGSSPTCERLDIAPGSRPERLRPAVTCSKLSSTSSRSRWARAATIDIAKRAFPRVTQEQRVGDGREDAIWIGHWRQGNERDTLCEVIFAMPLLPQWRPGSCRRHPAPAVSPAARRVAGVPAGWRQFRFAGRSGHPGAGGLGAELVPPAATNARRGASPSLCRGR